MLDADAILGLQRTVGNGAVTSLLEEERSPVHDVIKSGGRPLEPDVRDDMEARLGHDFSDVRVHDDTAAAASATAVNAHAYTVGSNVVFQRDKYDPSTQEGKTTLAHELTHVVQQRSGPVDGTSAPGGIKISNPSDRYEREAAANAERVMSAPAPVQTAAVSASGTFSATPCDRGGAWSAGHVRAAAGGGRGAGPRLVRAARRRRGRRGAGAGPLRPAR